MGLLFLVVLGYVVYLHTQLSGMRNDIQNLQRKHQAPASEVSSVSSQASTSLSVPPTSETSFIPQTQSTVSPAPKESPLVTWVKEDFFVKLGALLLLIAFGWFVNYAFANNWIGPMGRITLGLTAGVLVMMLGIWRIESYRQQGGIFTILGSAIVLLTAFAAREVYDFFTPAIALTLMTLSVIFVAFVSVRYHSEKIAIASLLLAAIAPFMTNSPEPSSLSLFSYWLLMVVGTVWVVKMTDSDNLIPIALLITGLYSVPFIAGMGTTSEDKLIGLLFSFAFTALFFVVNMISIAYKKIETAKQGHAVTALFTGLYLVSWVGFAAPEQWQSMLFLAWMLVFSVGAFSVYLHTTNRAPFYIYSAVGIGLLAAATAVELSGPVLTIAYSVELMILVMVLATILKDRTVTLASCVLFAGLGFSSLSHLNPRLWEHGFMHVHFVALLSVTLAFVSTAVLLFNTKPEEEQEVSQVPTVLTIIGLVYGVVLVWLMTHSVLTDDTATTVSLIVYTLLGIGLFIKGKLINSATMTAVGAILLGCVVARLLLVEIWHMDLIGRVVTFGAIGVLLISTAFIGKNSIQAQTEPLIAE